MSSNKFFLKNILFLFFLGNIIFVESKSPLMENNNISNMDNLSEEEIQKLQQELENISPEDYMLMLKTFFDEYSNLSEEEKGIFAEGLGISKDELEEMSNLYQEEMKNFNIQNNNITAEEPKKTENVTIARNPVNPDSSKKSLEEVKIFENSEIILSSFLSKTIEKFIFNTSIENFPNLISDVEISVYYIKFIIPLIKNLLESKSTEGLKEFEILKNFLKKLINLEDLISNIQINHLKKVHLEFENSLLQKYSARNIEEAERNIKNSIKNKITLIENIKASDIEKSIKDKKIAHEKFSLSELENDFEKLKTSNLESENENISKNISKQQEIVKNNFLEAAKELNNLFPEILDLLENFIKNYMPEEYKKLKENSDLIKKAYENEKSIFLSNAKKAKGVLILDNVKTNQEPSSKNYMDNNGNYSSDYEQSSYQNDFPENYSDYEKPADFSKNTPPNNNFVGGNNILPPAINNNNLNNNGLIKNSENKNFLKNENVEPANQSNKKLEEKKDDKEEPKSETEKELENFETLLSEYFSLIDKKEKIENKKELLEEKLNLIKNFIGTLNEEKLNFKKKESTDPFFIKILSDFFNNKPESEIFSLIIKKISNNDLEKLDSSYKTFFNSESSSEPIENNDDHLEKLDQLAKNDPVIKNLLNKFNYDEEFSDD